MLCLPKKVLLPPICMCLLPLYSASMTIKRLQKGGLDNDVKLELVNQSCNERVTSGHISWNKPMRNSNLVTGFSLEFHLPSASFRNEKTFILLETKVIRLCHQYTARPVCTSVQSEQSLYCWLTNFKFSSWYPYKW